MVTLLMIGLLIALITPLALILAGSRDGALDAKQVAIARALEMKAEHERLDGRVMVNPAMEIEEIWAIEDARTEAESALVREMYRGGDRLGYDAQSATFYCTLGVGLEDWPEISLSVRGEENVQVTWLDDYTYDWPSDAIREGYRYELLAYTAEEFMYIGVVFTGLPVVALEYEGEISMEDDVPGRVTIAAAGHEPIDSAMVVHERGGGYTQEGDKKSYRLEMHALGDNGKDEKQDLRVLGMEPDSDWLLLSNNGEMTTVRNKLAWDLWRDWHKGEKALMVMDSEMVEVFVNDQYMGVYQLMERIQEEEEIAHIGGDIHTDGVLRYIASLNPSEKPVWDLHEELDFNLEYRYESSGNAKRLFALAQDYISLLYTDDRRLDDETFASRVVECVDIEDMMNYILFYHVCTLQDNSKNNVYLYAMKQEDGSYIFRHAPWDMDSGFWVLQADTAHNVLRWPDMSMTLPTRMLDLNVGNCREVIWDLWNEKRASVLSTDEMYNRFMEMEQYINDSGAYLRESERWYGEAKTLNLSEIAYYHEQCMNLVYLTLLDYWPVSGKKLVQ